jgi:uncharacterized protein with NRDE domain
LIVLSRTAAESPLVVAANRDELYERPAVPMTVLQAAGPRILGGRDELAGGTWLAVNEDGLFAGLTNRPTTEGRDPTRRSRGELPVALARHATADDAVAWFAANVVATDYNPAWLFVGDRRSLFAVDLTEKPAPVVEELPPGVHILENRPLGAPSPKVGHVRELLADVEQLPLRLLERRLLVVLGDHELPPPSLTPDHDADGQVFVRPPATEAACVHTDRYGTRWSGIVAVPAEAGSPRFHFTPGPPCTTQPEDAAPLWRTSAAGTHPCVP